MSDGTTTDVEEIESGPTVFISYRRKDTGPEAEKLSIRLREDLGSTNVFRDEDDLIVGDRWQDTLGLDPRIECCGLPRWRDLAGPT